MPERDPLEADMLQGAASALRNRAERQAKLAQAGTMRGDRGVSVRTGEAAIADRLSAALSALAAEFEGAILDSESVLERLSSRV
jgi:hypothetical protein